MCQKHSTDFFTDRVTLLMLVAELSIKLTIFRRLENVIMSAKYVLQTFFY